MTWQQQAGAVTRQIADTADTLQGYTAHRTKAGFLRAHGTPSSQPQGRRPGSEGHVPSVCNQCCNFASLRVLGRSEVVDSNAGYYLGTTLVVPRDLVSRRVGNKGG
jgi:hypothetical protein